MKGPEPAASIAGALIELAKLSPVAQGFGDLDDVMHNCMFTAQMTPHMGNNIQRSRTLFWPKILHCILYYTSIVPAKKRYHCLPDLSFPLLHPFTAKYMVVVKAQKNA